MGFRCAACDGPGARWDAGRRTALCPPCEHTGRTAGREPVRLGDVLTAAGGDPAFAALRERCGPRRTSCRYCGATAEWHRTADGRWMLMEPGTHPAESVPPGRRRHTAADPRTAAPTGLCRVGHADVCPARSAPPDTPALLALWRRNARQWV
ncbi:DUF6083 domain-containing protein [Streptomyces peucetius]|uniref:DUF6083 domain-containing protein n=1 Tax=Streptomyces peucetius TaxID=1950 RepID=A0ABY6I763_STRPE|nr:DUF6083 domain-containing protein [Streptomyces peucetius]UYQ61804.1 DUF6083 domain-containing protein [Streptomyces peucetius]